LSNPSGITILEITKEVWATLQRENQELPTGDEKKKERRKTQKF